MKTEIRTFGLTQVSSTMPWGLTPPYGHRLLCSDGVIRAARLAHSPDTFFSHPASVRIKGKNVTGYMTTEEFSYHPDLKEEDYRDTTVYVFRHHNGQDEYLPKWPVVSEDGAEKLNALIAKAKKIKNLPDESTIRIIVNDIKSDLARGECRDLTIGVGKDSWGYQTGDNSYTGGAYSFSNWIVASVNKQTKIKDLLRDIMSQYNELNP